jgi:hypothetical protein
MVIDEVSAQQVLATSRGWLGLPASTAAADDAMLASLARRAAGILCPCSSSTLASAVKEALHLLVDDSDELTDCVNNAVEGLVIGGDLLELSNVATEDPDVKGTWVFPAPPAFVVRPSGTVFILGIVPDEASPLPASLNARIAHEGYARILLPQASEDLPSVLRGLGLLPLAEAVWLRAPKQESAGQLREAIVRRLGAQLRSGAIAELSILDPARSVTYYRGRWSSPKRETGLYVARRPQAYGSALWGFAQLEDGAVTRFIDFPLKGTRWRGCDVAWHLQMAIDYLRGSPQLYRRRTAPNGVLLDFFSPLPLWAQRRLAIIGRRVPAEKCLFSYLMSEREAAAEEAFLQQRLWLKQNIGAEVEAQ